MGVKWRVEDLAALDERRLQGSGTRKKRLDAPQGKQIESAGKITGVVKVAIKPLSVNAAWAGRRFKTPAYKNYEKAVLSMLPKYNIPNPPFEIYLKFGFSSRASDFDNPTKLVCDLLSKKYGFNDKLIRRAVIETEIVKKGQEYFQFQLTHLDC